MRWPMLSLRDTGVEGGRRTFPCEDVRQKVAVAAGGSARRCTWGKEHAPGVGVRDDALSVRLGRLEPWRAGSAVVANLVCCFAASCLSFACSCAQDKVLYEREGAVGRGS